MKLKKAKAAGIVYAVLAAAPLLLSVIFYGAYPQSVAVHWNASGEADGFAPAPLRRLPFPRFCLSSCLELTQSPKAARNTNGFTPRQDGWRSRFLLSFRVRY